MTQPPTTSRSLERRAVLSTLAALPLLLSACAEDPLYINGRAVLAWVRIRGSWTYQCVDGVCESGSGGLGGSGASVIPGAERDDWGTSRVGLSSATFSYESTSSASDDGRSVSFTVTLGLRDGDHKDSRAISGTANYGAEPVAVKLTLSVPDTTVELTVHLSVELDCPAGQVASPTGECSPIAKPE